MKLGSGTEFNSVPDPEFVFVISLVSMGYLNIPKL